MECTERNTEIDLATDVIFEDWTVCINEKMNILGTLVDDPQFNPTGKDVV